MFRMVAAVGSLLLFMQISTAGAIELNAQVRSQLAAAPAIRDAVTDAAFDGRPVVVTFFASWCPPCAAEFGEITNYIEGNGEDKVSVIAVNWIEDLVPRDPNRMRRMLARIHPSIPVVEADGNVADSFDGVLSIPAAFIFDPDGQEIFRLGGDRGPHGRHFMTAADLAAAIDGVGRS